MSEDHVAVVRRMYDAFREGDAEGALGHFAADVMVDATARPDGAIGQGRDVVWRVVGSWIAMFDQWREDIEEIRDLGDHVLVAATQRGRGKGSGIETENRYALLYRVNDGEISAMTLYTDVAAAVAAAGPAGA